MKKKPQQNWRMFTFLQPQMWSELRSQREFNKIELRWRWRLLCAEPPPGRPGNETSPYSNEITLRRNPQAQENFWVYRLAVSPSDFGLVKVGNRWGSCVYVFYSLAPLPRRKLQEPRTASIRRVTSWRVPEGLRSETYTSPIIQEGLQREGAESTR